MHLAAFQDAEKRARIPDPNAQTTYGLSAPDAAEAERPPHAAILATHRRLLALRHARIIPQLPGAHALGAQAMGDAAVLARWRLGDGSTLTLACNLGAEPVSCTAQGEVIYESVAGGAAALGTGSLPARCTVALIATPEPRAVADGPMMKGPG